MQLPTGFVRLSADRRRFELDGAPFFFTGCNSYYLMTRAADPGLQQQVLEVLDDAKSAGLTVVRTWAFNDGPEWNALQPTPGSRSQLGICMFAVIAFPDIRSAWLGISTLSRPDQAFVSHNTALRSLVTVQDNLMRG